MATPPTRLSALKKLQASIFGHTYNPLNIRMGNKVLRQRLRGPAIASYYQPRTWSISHMAKLFPNWETFDEAEADRVDQVVMRKARGKGPPKKKRTADDSKKKSKKR